MHELIWVGNTLLPRGVVFGALAVAVLLVAVVITIISNVRRTNR